MIGRPVRINWRKEDTPERLKAAYLAQRDSILRTRLHGLWLVRSGWGLGEAARVVGVHERTVQTWCAGTEREVWRRCSLTRWEAEVSRAI